MYCRKCGKKIEYDAEMCLECQENEELFTRADEKPETQPIYEYTQPVQSVQPMGEPIPEKKGSVMKGFGLALASVIVSMFSISFLYGIIMGFEEALGGYDGSAMYVSIEPSVYFLYILGLAMAVFALVGGIISMTVFFKAKKNGEVKPLPALIMGIVSVVESAGSLLLALLVLIIFIMI